MTSVTGGDHGHNHGDHHGNGQGDDRGKGKGQGDDKGNGNDNGKGDDRIWSLSQKVSNLIGNRDPGNNSFGDSPTITAANYGGAVTVNAGTSLGDDGVTFLSKSGLSTVLGGGAATLFGGSGNLVAALDRQGDGSAGYGDGAMTLSGGNQPPHLPLGIIDFAASMAGGQSLEHYVPHSGGSGSTLTLSDNTKIAFITMTNGH